MRKCWWEFSLKLGHLWMDLPDNGPSASERFPVLKFQYVLVLWFGPSGVVVVVVVVGGGETLVLGTAGGQDYLFCSRPNFITFSLGLVPL